MQDQGGDLDGPQAPVDALQPAPPVVFQRGDDAVVGRECREGVRALRGRPVGEVGRPPQRSQAGAVGLVVTLGKPAFQVVHLGALLGGQTPQA